MTEKLSKADADKKIQELAKTAYAALTEAEELADATGNEFSFNPAYGMGGRYVPDASRVGEWEGDREDYELKTKDYHGNELEGGGWLSSSSSC